MSNGIYDIEFTHTHKHIQTHALQLELNFIYSFYLNVINQYVRVKRWRTVEFKEIVQTENTDKNGNYYIFFYGHFPFQTVYFFSEAEGQSTINVSQFMMLEKEKREIYLQIHASFNSTVWM